MNGDKDVKIQHLSSALSAAQATIIRLERELKEANLRYGATLIELSESQRKLNEANAG